MNTGPTGRHFVTGNFELRLAVVRLPDEAGELEESRDTDAPVDTEQVSEDNSDDPDA